MAKKLHCKRGHPFTERNTYMYKGSQYCRTCMREATKKYREAKQNFIEEFSQNVPVERDVLAGDEILDIQSEQELQQIEELLQDQILSLKDMLPRAGQEEEQSDQPQTDEESLQIPPKE